MRFRNHWRLRNSSRNFPLNDSSVAFCHGFPGSISAVSMPASPSQRKMAVATNSGPLSDRRCRGAPCTLTSWASTSITRPERMPPATSIARHSRVHSSTIVRHLSVCRFAQVSNTKSYAHTWFRAVGGSGRGRPVATRRRGRRRGTCNPAWRQSRCVRSGLITCPSRLRKIRVRRYP